MFNICLDAHRPPSCSSVPRSLLLLEKLKSPQAQAQALAPLAPFFQVLVPNARDHEAPDARPAASAWARASRLKNPQGFFHHSGKQSVLSPSAGKP